MAKTTLGQSGLNSIINTRAGTGAHGDLYPTEHVFLPHVHGTTQKGKKQNIKFRTQKAEIVRPLNL